MNLSQAAPVVAAMAAIPPMPAVVPPAPAVAAPQAPPGKKAINLFIYFIIVLF